MRDRIAVIGAPTSRASHTGGQEKAPAVLRRAGIVGLLNAGGHEVVDLGDLPVARFRPDPSSPRAQNVDDVVRTVGEVAALVRRGLGSGAWPLVLGGDCTIALGALSALVAEGREPALVYVDAHGDLNVPDAVPYGALDWMGLAHALGVDGAEPRLAAAGARVPLIAPANVRLFATVREQLTTFESGVVAALDLAVTDAGEVEADPRVAARRAVESLPGGDVWLHLDVDAIDSMDLPVADFYQLNRGLPFDTLCLALEELLAAPAVVGMSIGQFNPDHTDEHGEDAARFVRGVVSAIGVRRAERVA